MAINDYSSLRASRYSRGSNSEGMKTEGKERFSNKLTYRIDFTDHEKSIREVRENIIINNERIRKLEKQLKKSDTGYGIYLDYRAVLPTKPGTSLMGFELPQNAQFLSSELGRKVAPLIGQRGKDIMRRYSRVETGRMRSSIVYMQRRRGNDKVDIEIGWVRRWHKYFGWQEDGTTGGRGNGRGIKPMRSIARTMPELDAYAGRVLSNFYSKTFLQKGMNK